MKNKIYQLICAFSMMVAGMSLSSCSDDAWGNDNPETENVFYFGFQDWGKLNNNVAYSVAQGQTVQIPVQFWCAGSRSFDAESFYYVDTSLVLGTDFLIVDESGNQLQPDESGAFSMLWKLTGNDTTDNHRVQHIFLKALQGAKGDVTIMTFNPKDVDADGKLKISNGSTDLYA